MATILFLKLELLLIQFFDKFGEALEVRIWLICIVLPSICNVLPSICIVLPSVDVPDHDFGPFDISDRVDHVRQLAAVRELAVIRQPDDSWFSSGAVPGHSTGKTQYLTAKAATMVRRAIARVITIIISLYDTQTKNGPEALVVLAKKIRLNASANIDSCQRQVERVRRLSRAKALTAV